MRCCIRWFLGLTIVALLVGGPLAYLHDLHANFRNFHIVRDGVLYRSGQLSLAALKRVIHDYDIRTVVTLRDAHKPDDPAPDAVEERYCTDMGMKYVRIPPRAWWAPDNSVPADQGVRAFLQIMDDPANFPVLVHCFAGNHRSGAYCAVYRMEYEGWSNRNALDEMKNYGYTSLDEDIDLLWYLEDYRPRRFSDASLRRASADASEKRR